MLSARFYDDDNDSKILFWIVCLLPFLKLIYVPKPRDYFAKPGTRQTSMEFSPLSFFNKSIECKNGILWKIWEQFSIKSLLIMVYFAERLECSSIAQKTGVQSQVESYQRFKKWYLMPPCLALSIIRYGSRAKWSNPRKGVTPFPGCSSYWKGNFQVTLDYGRQLYF